MTVEFLRGTPKKRDKSFGDSSNDGHTGFKETWN